MRPLECELALEHKLPWTFHGVALYCPVAVNQGSASSGSMTVADGLAE
jgi:hypothetical protein